MKSLLLTSSLFLFLVFSCAPVASPDHSGEGEVDNSGRASGNWTLFSDPSSSIFAKGAYLDGKPHGSWELWDDKGVKNAELFFDKGRYSGEYRLYYTAFTVGAAGRLKTVGSVENGSFMGDFTRYNTDGSVLVNYYALNNTVSTVQQGLRVDAEEQLLADMALLKAYKTAIVGAQHNRSMTAEPFSEEPIYR